MLPEMVLSLKLSVSRQVSALSKQFTRMPALPESTLWLMELKYKRLWSPLSIRLKISRFLISKVRLYSFFVSNNFSRQNPSHK